MIQSEHKYWSHKIDVHNLSNVKIHLVLKQKVKASKTVQEANFKLTMNITSYIEKLQRDGRYIWQGN